MSGVTSSGSGWLFKCPACDVEQYAARRPAADRLLSDHAKKCKPREKREAVTPKARPRADWTAREDSTWIDKL